MYEESKIKRGRIRIEWDGPEVEGKECGGIGRRGNNMNGTGTSGKEGQTEQERGRAGKGREEEGGQDPL